MKDKVLRIVLPFVLGTVISAASFPAYSRSEEDWKAVARGVRIANLDRGESGKCDIYRNVINGRYAVLPADEPNKMMYYVEYSDRPSYKYMFIYGNEFFGRKWYFNVRREFRLPIQDDLEFVSLIKAYSDAHSGYFRLFRSVVDNSLIVRSDNPYLGHLVYDSDNPKYRYRFSVSGINWYFFSKP